MKEDSGYLELIMAIADCKKAFERNLEDKLSLIKVGCPLFVKTDSGLQDALTGVEKGVSFYKNDEKFEVVHSLAKWKRDALAIKGSEAIKSKEKIKAWI